MDRLVKQIAERGGYVWWPTKAKSFGFVQRRVPNLLSFLECRAVLSNRQPGRHGWKA